MLNLDYFVCAAAANDESTEDTCTELDWVVEPIKAPRATKKKETVVATTA